MQDAWTSSDIHGLASTTTTPTATSDHTPDASTPEPTSSTPTTSVNPAATTAIMTAISPITNNGEDTPDAVSHHPHH
nr:unnamed protein product [Spirometra erinaceieuropaei]